ncbi:hypothetical protein OF387_17560 [Lentilactobacillus hilgardii]|nr:hypothetical protein [Lentilactobacillus hilgardii]
MMNLFIVGRLFLCSRDQGRQNAFPLDSSGKDLNGELVRRWGFFFIR